MSLSSLSSAQLHRLIELVKEKESLQSKLAKVESALDGNGTPAKTAGIKRGPRRKLKRGALKDGVLGKLRAAGKEGLKVKDLASSLSANPASLSVWFYTTGKKVKGIKKVGTARYAYLGE
jgi:hypothetical protein